MSLFQIKHRITGNVLFERDCDSMRICVEAAVESRANLAGAAASTACAPEFHVTLWLYETFPTVAAYVTCRCSTTPFVR